MTSLGAQVEFIKIDVPNEYESLEKAALKRASYEVLHSDGSAESVVERKNKADKSLKEIVRDQLESSQATEAEVSAPEAEVDSSSESGEYTSEERTTKERTAKESTAKESTPKERTAKERTRRRLQDKLDAVNSEVEEKKAKAKKSAGFRKTGKSYSSEFRSIRQANFDDLRSIDYSRYDYDQDDYDQDDYGYSVTGYSPRVHPETPKYRNRGLEDLEEYRRKEIQTGIGKLADSIYRTTTQKGRKALKALGDAISLLPGPTPCVYNPDMFFNEMMEENAKLLCNGTASKPPCPVRELCLLAALYNNEDYGVWGGTSTYDRRRMKARESRAAEYNSLRPPTGITTIESQARAREAESLRRMQEQAEKKARLDAMVAVAQQRKPDPHKNRAIDPKMVIDPRLKSDKVVDKALKETKKPVKEPITGIQVDESVQAKIDAAPVKADPSAHRKRVVLKGGEKRKKKSVAKVESRKSAQAKSPSQSPAKAKRRKTPKKA